MVSPPGGGPIGVRLTCFCAALYRLPLVPLILPAASISPSAWRWVRPHYILGIQAAVPFVNKPLWFYASSLESQIARNSEYLCVVCVSQFWEAKAQNGTALPSIALVCNVTCFSVSLSRFVANMAPSAMPQEPTSCRQQHLIRTDQVRDPVSVHSPWCGVHHCHVHLLGCGLFTNVVSSSVYKTSTDGTICEP